MQACEKMDARRFLTLTMVSTDDSLADRLKALRDSFAKLRRHAFWKARVTGGVYCVEVTWNPELKQWHPHLHAIVDGKYVPKQQLIEAWKAATGDSYIVHIESVHSASRCASYVAKYASKSDDAAKLPDHKVAEWAESVHGLRLVHTFGNLHGVQLVEKPEKTPGVCIEVCNPSWMALAANGGDLVAASILRSIDRSAAGCPIEADSLVLKRIANWQSWMLVEARSRREALPPPDPPPQSVLFPE